MRAFLISFESAGLWTLFFATGVFGHVALKLAVGSDPAQNAFRSFAAVASPWGLSALASWTASLALWLVVLPRFPLIQAASLSTLRYLGICLAAWLFLKEGVSLQQGLGVTLIALGVALVAR